MYLIRTIGLIAMKTQGMREPTASQTQTLLQSLRHKMSCAMLAPPDGAGTAERPERDTRGRAGELHDHLLDSGALLNDGRAQRVCLTARLAASV